MLDCSQRSGHLKTEHTDSLILLRHHLGNWSAFLNAMCFLKYLLNCEQHVLFSTFKSRLFDIWINCNQIDESILYLQPECAVCMKYVFLLYIYILCKLLFKEYFPLQIYYIQHFLPPMLVQGAASSLPFSYGNCRTLYI
jgi:hypothetical protein